MSRCEDYIEHISTAIDGELSPQQRAQLDAHLAQCPECRALMEELTRLHVGLASLPPAAPPQGLSETIMAAVGSSNVTAFPAKKPFHWKKWLSSAAVLALIVAAGWSWRTGSFGDASSADPMQTAPNGNTADQSTAAAASVPEIASTGDESVSIARAAEPAPMSISAPSDSTSPAESGSYTGTSNASDEPAAIQAKTAANPGEIPAEPDLEPVEESGMVPPRMFFAIAPSETEEQPVTASETDGQLPLMSAPPAADNRVEEPSSLMSAPPVTAEEAVTALANYIYEFVGDVELLSPPEGDAIVYAVNSPTGVSGSITLTGEDEALFFLEYRDSEGGETLRYTVDKADATVTWLGDGTED